VEEGRAGALLELNDAHLDHVYLFGRIEAVVDFGPEFGVHLDFDIIEIVLFWYFCVDVAFGYVV